MLIAGYIQRHLRVVALLVLLLVGVAVLGWLVCVGFGFGVVFIGEKHDELDVSLAIRSR